MCRMACFRRNRLRETWLICALTWTTLGRVGPPAPRKPGWMFTGKVQADYAIIADFKPIDRISFRAFSALSSYFTAQCKATFRVPYAYNV